jgi:hypothetical protein
MILEFEILTSDHIIQNSDRSCDREKSFTARNVHEQMNYHHKNEHVRSYHPKKKKKEKNDIRVNCIFTNPT